MSHLFQELRDCVDVESVLLQNADLIAQDPDLAQVYQRLGFSTTQQAFLHPPSRDLVLSLFAKEMMKTDMYLDLDPPRLDDWDVRRGLKNELLPVSDDTYLPLSADFPDYTEDPPPIWKPEPEFQTIPSSRGNKGLKKLSVAVKTLIVTHGAMTYKDVADRLISKMEDTEAEKEEKNIRRRVYDALNVLIAAEVLVKEGKEVRLKPVSRVRAEPVTGDYEKRVETKQQQLVSLSEQYKSLCALIQRNQKRPTNRRIGLPFIVLATNQPQEAVSIVTDFERHGLRILLPSQPRLIGDLEVIRQLESLDTQDITLPAGLQPVISDLV